jgi:hypothetical protein
LILDREPGPLRAALRASDSYGLVLVLLIVIFLLVPAGSGHRWIQVIVVFLQGFTMLFALHTARVHPLTMRFAITLFGVASVLAVAAAVTGGRAQSAGAIALLGALLLAVTPAAMLRRILFTETVDAQTILGALSVYVIFGLFFSALFTWIGAISPTPFFGNKTNPQSGDYQFFSFVTMTTVGYGNLVPALQIGQSLAVLEALFGQIYLVTLVAALVSRFQPGQRYRERIRASEEHRSAERAPPGSSDDQRAAVGTEETDRG